MSEDLAILEALTGHFDALDLPAIAAVKYPGKSFAKPEEATAIWVMVSLFPVEPSTYGLASGPTTYAGYLQATVCQRLGRGGGEVLDVAGAISDHFPDGTSHQSDGLTVQIMGKPGINKLFEDEGEIKAPVIIRYQALA